jgi:hypothetical protein
MNQLKQLQQEEGFWIFAVVVTFCLTSYMFMLVK